MAVPARTERQPFDRRFRLQFAGLFAVAIGAIAIIVYGVFGTDDAERAEMFGLKDRIVAAWAGQR